MNGRVALALVLVLPLEAAETAAPSLDGLVKNSPFSPAAAGTTSATAETMLEFRGVLVDRGETFFSLYDPASRASMWVGLKEPGNPFVVQSYDADKAVATVEFQGRTLTLALKQAKVAVGAAAPTVAPGATAPPNAAPRAQTDEASRLAAVADEIRRRRALRAQAVQPSPAPSRPTRSNP